MPESTDKPSKASAVDAEIRATCAVLEAIAQQYPKGSPERTALREASLAFSYLKLHETLKTSYASFRQHLHGPLPEEQQVILKRMGVEVE